MTCARLSEVMSCAGTTFSTGPVAPTALAPGDPRRLKVLGTITETEEAGGPCESMAQAEPFHQRVFDWLDEFLSQTRQATS